MKNLEIIATAINSTLNLATQDFLTIAAILEYKFGIITTTTEVGEAFDAMLINEEAAAEVFKVNSKGLIAGRW